jgi:hypothetical protein
MIPAALWGHFRGRVVTEWLDSDGEDRVMRLTPETDLVFERPSGECIAAHVGLTFDGASIPSLAWPLVGSPFTGKFRKAAVIHDSLCRRKDRPYRDAHRVMYEAMRSRGMWFRGPIMYRVLLWFGSRW